MKEQKDLGMPVCQAFVSQTGYPPNVGIRNARVAAGSAPSEDGVELSKREGDPGMASGLST